MRISEGVPLAALDKITGHVYTAMNEAQRVALARDLGEAKRHAATSTEEGRAALRALKSAGGTLADMPPPSPVPLSLLSTPAGRELLAVLRQAEAVAERVDAERGRVGVPAGAGDVAGLDLAEAVHFLVLRVSGEVEGAFSGRE